MKSTRQGFGDQLVESAVINRKVVSISCDLASATRQDAMAKVVPGRCFEVGIAENNAIGIAAGMAAQGFRPFVGSFASFLTGKYDTIRVSVVYPKYPVVLVGTHSGLAVGRDGTTQQGLEDLALMRALPGMTILQPATYNEAREITKWLCEVEELPGPVYLRLGRQDVDEYSFIGNEEWEIGKVRHPVYGGMPIAVPLGSTKIYIMSSGCLLSLAIDVAKRVSTPMVVPVVANCSTIKCQNPGKEVFGYLSNSESYRYGLVVTIEDHSIIGGLGDAVAAYLAGLSGEKPRLLKFGVPDYYLGGGTPEDLYKAAGLTVDAITQRIAECPATKGIDEL